MAARSAAGRQQFVLRWCCRLVTCLELKYSGMIGILSAYLFGRSKYKILLILRGPFVYHNGQNAVITTGVFKARLEELKILGLSLSGSWDRLVRLRLLQSE